MLRETQRLQVTALLKDFGLTPRETAIYLILLQTGPASVQQIAQKTRQNRVTTYSAIEQLLVKGLLSETRRGKRRLLAAEDPTVIQRLVQKKKTELEVLESKLQSVTSILKNIQKKDASLPTVRFYEDIDGFKKMLEETLQTKKEVLVFSYVDFLADLIDPQYLEDYFKRRADKGIHTRLIFPPGAFAKRIEKKSTDYNIDIKYLPSELVWQSGIFAWDNSLALLSYTENKLTCTIIENEDLAYFYRNIIFELCWQQAKVK